MSTDSEAASAPTAPPGPTGRLATWVAEVAAKDIPERVRERTSYALLDGFGCGLVGQLPWSRTAVAVLTSVGDPGTHSLIGWDRKVPGRAEGSVT